MKKEGVCARKLFKLLDFKILLRKADLQYFYSFVVSCNCSDYVRALNVRELPRVSANSRMAGK